MAAARLGGCVAQSLQGPAAHAAGAIPAEPVHRATQGEAVLRDLMAHPTSFVSKEQAAITLARYLTPKKPAEARKLLDPLRSQPGAVGQAAISAYAELPNQ